MRLIERTKARLGWRGRERIFCLSFQKTGTTSVEVFLRGLNYPVAGWPVTKRNRWHIKAAAGRFQDIFRSVDFACYQAFADTPWFYPGLHRALFARYPNARFILLERDPAGWFDSLRHHGGGAPLEDPIFHAQVYAREADLLRAQETGEAFRITPDHAAHYQSVYTATNQAVSDFFMQHAPAQFFRARLEDNATWDALARFLGEENTIGPVHANKRRIL